MSPGRPQRMLVIRKEQMAVLRAYMTGRFRAKVLKHFRTDLTEETRPLSREAALALVDEGLARARTYGVRSERDVMLFIDLMVLYSPQFEDTPALGWSKRILQNPELSGDVKMSLIYQLLAARQAREAKT